MNLRIVIRAHAEVGGLMGMFTAVPVACGIPVESSAIAGVVLGLAAWIFLETLNIRADREQKRAAAIKRHLHGPRRHFGCECQNCGHPCAVEPCGNYWCDSCGLRGNVPVYSEGFATMKGPPS